MGARTHFVIADVGSTGLATGVVSAVVSLDALQYARDRAAAAAEARRILRRHGRIVLTGWHPRLIGEPRLPERHRHTNWPAVLSGAGFIDVKLVARPLWATTYLDIYRTALAMGDPGQDVSLAALQGEAQRRLPTAHLLHRIAVTAVAA